MRSQPKRSIRIYSLDSLRAIMMLLGLVLHSAITYGVYENSAWSLKDSITHISNDYIVSFIHTFRMQIFFIVAGFFGSMLFYERKPLEMIKNRAARIVSPFIVFMFLLWPTTVFAFGYTRLVLEGNVNALEDSISVFSNLFILVPRHTFHLWFLYYLALITSISIVLALVLQKLPSITNNISRVFNWIINKSIARVIIFASITATVYFIIGSWSVSTSTSIVPDFNILIYYLAFYIIGWILFKSKHLLDTFMKYDWLFTILAVVLFSIYFFMSHGFSYISHVIIKSIMVWLFIFGITGLFIRYASNHSSIMRYISDASYWVYLIHLPLTAIIPGLISDWIIPATLKFLLVFIITSMSCFLSYHYFVRGTFIGQFLNGRRYS
ncbi:MAG: acyltransferase family protein, partial [Candidatus Marinimicrobia bacterium]|nr:acyltransferase family protein [Candidatus Neomarinimicrobiota bacterium]